MNEFNRCPVIKRDHLRAAGERDGNDIQSNLGARPAHQHGPAGASAAFRRGLEDGFEQFPAHESGYSRETVTKRKPETMPPTIPALALRTIGVRCLCL